MLGFLRLLAASLYSQCSASVLGCAVMPLCAA